MSPGAWNPAAGRVEVQLTPHTLDGLCESGHIAAGIVPTALERCHLRAGEAQD